jgi:PAS domain S-box-containing protein
VTPLATLYGAVALSVWFSGSRPAVVVVALGYLACNWLFVQPRGAFGFDTPRNLIGLLAYLLSCSIIIGFGQAMRSARRKAEASRDGLEREAARHREAEQRFRLAAEAVNGIIYECDFLIGHVERTRGLYEVLGYRPDEVPPTQAWWVEQIHPDDRDWVTEVDPAVVRATNAPVEYRLRHKDGRWLHVEDRAVLVRDGHGKPIKLIGCTLDVTARRQAEEAVLRDVTERKRAEAALAGQKRVLEMVATDAPLADVLATLCEVVEEQETGLHCSALLLDKARRQIRVGAAPSLPEPYISALNGLSIEPPYFGPCGMALDTGRAVVVEDAQADDRWSAAWRELASAHGLRTCFSMPITAPDGSVLGTFAVYRRQSRHPDPSEPRTMQIATQLAAIAIRRKQADEQRAELLARLETLFAHAPIGIALFDPDLRFVTLNERTAVVDGVPKDAHLGKTVTELPPQLGPKVEAVLRRVRDTGESISGLEMSGETPAAPGQQRHWLANYYPVRNGSDRLLGVGAVALEITDRKQAEERLRQSEAFNRTLLASSLTGMYVYDVDAGRNVFVNPQYTKITGYTQNDLERMDAPSFLALFHADDRDAVLAHMEKVAEAGPGCESEIEYRFKTADGRWAHLLSRDTLLPQSDGPGRRLLGTFVDITGRKRQEKELEDSRRTLSTLVERCPFGIYIVDADFRIAHMNDGSQAGAFANVRPVVGRAFEEAMRTLWPGPVAADIIQKFRHTLQTGKPYFSKDFVNPRADIDQTEGYEWELHRITLPDGRHGVVCYYYNSTRLRQAERALQEADRKKDEFLATLAHELRNPLAPIRNAVQVVKAKSPDIPELVWARDLIERQVAQMARLLDDLLDVSRITRSKMELRKCRVTLAGVVESAVETSRPVIDAGGHELGVALPSEPVDLDADPVRLAQVFANLLNNAAKYTDREGHIRLAAETVGHEVVVSVKDDGIGIERDMLPRLFEMFAQATPALERSQGGLGIGLSLVKGLVEMHGGSVEARSDGPGKGSEFVIRLPIATPTEVRKQGTAEAEKPSATGCKIVVADDNRDAADSLAMLLQVTGNEVRTANDGQHAVEVAEAFRPDVVLLDIGMPRLNGYDACRRLREQPWGRDILIVALTGWGQEEDKRRSEEAGFNTHMVKPVAPAALERLLATRTAPRGQ